MINNSYYTGIGSRKTPPDICELMTKVARKAADSGAILRSGHAEGADQAFERGAGNKAEIYLPWEGFNNLLTSNYYDFDYDFESPIIYSQPLPICYKIAEKFHPAWYNCSRGARALHARNVHQILGPEPYDTNISDYVICWTPDGSLDGRGPNTRGTGQTLRIAYYYDVEIVNLARSDHRKMIENWLTGSE